MAENAPPVAVAVGIVPLYLVPYPSDLVEPFRVTVSMLAAPSGGEDTGVVNAPAIAVSVAMRKPGTVDALLVLSSPEQDEVVIIAQPQLVVGLQSTDLYADYQIEIQYADNAAFTGAVSALVDAQAIDGGITYVPPSPAFATTYWRARLFKDGTGVLDWTDAKRFTVDLVNSAKQIAVTWTVDSAADRPVHLWHFDPPGVEEGDEVTVYGQGFPLTPGLLSLYGQPVAVESWSLVPASGVAVTDRVIDGDVVDAEHFEVLFIAPPVEEPGGPLTVEA